MATVRGSVYATVRWDPGGAGPLPTWLVVGGLFWSAPTAGGPANNIVRLSGSSWQPLGSGTNNEVRVFARLNSDLIVGGDASGSTFVFRWTGTEVRRANSNQ